MRTTSPNLDREAAMLRMLKGLRDEKDPNALAKTALMFPELSEPAVEADNAFQTLDLIADVGLQAWAHTMDTESRVTISVGSRGTC